MALPKGAKVEIEVIAVANGPQAILPGKLDDDKAESLIAKTFPRATSPAGERTRLACWRWRPRHRELFSSENIAARRRNEHASRVRSPENYSSGSSIRSSSRAVR
jgi:hypothetical protein